MIDFRIWIGGSWARFVTIPVFFHHALREGNPRYPPFELLRVHSTHGKMLPSAQWGQYHESAALNEVTGYDSLRHSPPLCIAFLTPSVPVQYGPDDHCFSRGTGGGNRPGREVRWLIWARNCPTKSNFISPEACLDNRATKWPAANLTISSTNFAGDYFTRCSLSLSRPPLGAHAAPSSNGRCFPRVSYLSGRETCETGGRNPTREKSLSWKRPPTYLRWMIDPLVTCVNDRIVLW